MTIPARFTLAKETTALPIVCIDAANQNYVQPLREFFELNGCQVFINRQPALPATYQIVYGGADFVKRFFLRTAKVSAKVLIILTDENKTTASRLSEFYGKTVLIENTVILNRELRGIFNFFFTSRSRFLDLRKDKSEKIPTENLNVLGKPQSTPFVAANFYHQRPVVKETHNRVSELKIDQQRIDQTIKEIYAPKKMKKNFFGQKKLRFWLLAIFITPPAWYAVCLAVSILTLFIAGIQIKNGQMQKAISTSVLSSRWIDRGRSTLRLAAWPVFFLKQQQLVRSQENLWQLLAAAAKTEKGSAQLILYGIELSKKLFITERISPGEQSTAAVFEKMKAVVFELQQDAGLLKAQFEQMKKGRLLAKAMMLTNFDDKADYQIARLQDVIGHLDRLLTIYPLIGGFGKDQAYLLLLQNSMELRPTGGFIGSIATVNFSDGQTTNFQIQDVYSLDGQLRGHVDPPGPLREILGQEHWYLRDSNWDPDFRNSGQQALWFYEKESGSKPDGAIAISTPLIIDLLKATGPIDLPDYNDKITADNFFGKSYFYTQIGFFPGSTQKKDFLGSLFNVLIAKITSAKGVNPVGLYEAFARALDRHDIMFYFNDQQLQNLAERYLWSGAVPSFVGCQDNKGNCLFDPQYLVDANLAVNKVNYFVEKSQITQINIDNSGKLQKSITLFYHNKSAAVGPGADKSGERAGGGTYRNYARLLIPADATEFKIKLDGQDLPLVSRKFKNLPVVPYAEYLNSQKPEVGIAFDVASGQSVQLSVAYVRQSLLTFRDEKAALEVFEQKQPGVAKVTSQLVVKYPLTWKAEIEKTSANAKQDPPIAKEGRVEYNTDLSSDNYLKLKFTKL